MGDRDRGVMPLFFSKAKTVRSGQIGAKMKIHKNQDGDKLTLEISGRLETSTAPALQEVVENELFGVLHLRVEMGDLEYISSAGLRTLLAAKKKMKAVDGTMVVTGVNEEVMEVFKITGFDDILDIE